MHGGKNNAANLYISPTLIKNVGWDSPIMQEEIFGPLLPILSYETIEEVVESLKSKEKPLAFYVFSENKTEINLLKTQCHFGGACINDTISHLLNNRLPFGGVGNSGMGGTMANLVLMLFLTARLLCTAVLA